MNAQRKPVVDDRHTVPDNSIIITLSPQGEWLKWTCSCGSTESMSMFNGDADTLFSHARRHNILQHRDTFTIVDRS